MSRLVLALTLACLIFLACLANTTRTKAEVKAKEPAPVNALCFDPFAQFTGIQFESCDRVNRYWNA